MTTYNRCLDAYNGKHYVKIPHCDFVDMYDWLLNIGERNRLKIRYIHISLSGSQFAKVLGEQHLVDDPLKPSPLDPKLRSCEHITRTQARKWSISAFWGNELLCYPFFNERHILTSSDAGN